MTTTTTTALLVFLFVIVVNSISNGAAARMKLPANVSVPAIIIFGDSIMDTGNNNNLPTTIKCNFPPYGVDFNGGNPTGRFCDGKIPSDIIAEALGIKSSVPAYLDPSLQPNDLLTGVSFASGGAGFDPLTAKIVSVVTLSQQLQYFQDYVSKVKAMVGEDRTNFILSNALFFVVAGSDDIANTYFLLRARSQYDVPSYTELMSDSASNFIQVVFFS
ncbi:GDSL esterase/lipase EXL3 [Linum grandiflorum]